MGATDASAFCLSLKPPSAQQCCNLLVKEGLAVCWQPCSAPKVLFICRILYRFGGNPSVGKPTERQRFVNLCWFVTAGGAETGATSAERARLGLVTLRKEAEMGAATCTSLCRDLRSFAPRGERLGSEEPVGASDGEVTGSSERVVNSGVHCQELLR